MKEEKSLTISELECPLCGKKMICSLERDYEDITTVKKRYICTDCDYEQIEIEKQTMDEVRAYLGMNPVKPSSIPESDSVTTTHGETIHFPMSAEVHAELEKKIKPEEQPCGFCGSLMEYQGVAFSRDLNHIVVHYQCPVCGRNCEKHRELYNYGVQVLDNSGVVNTIIEGRDANPDEPNIRQEALNKIVQFSCPNCPDDKGCLNCNIKDSCNALAKYYVDILQKTVDTANKYDKKDIGDTDGDVMDYKAEYEKLLKRNCELGSRISELEEQLYLRPLDKMECVSLDYEAEYHRAQDEIEALKQELHHCKHIISHMTHLI